MSERLAYIGIMESYESVSGRSYRTGYFWIGELDDPVFLYEAEISRLAEMPWNLKEVEEVRIGDRILRGDEDGRYFVRANIPWYAHYRFEEDFEEFWWRLTSFGCKLILSLMILGWAHVPEDETPSWRHIAKRYRPIRKNCKIDGAIATTTRETQDETVDSRVDGRFVVRG